MSIWSDRRCFIDDEDEYMFLTNMLKHENDGDDEEYEEGEDEDD